MKDCVFRALYPEGSRVRYNGSRADVCEAEIVKHIGSCSAIADGDEGLSVLCDHRPITEVILHRVSQIAGHIKARLATKEPKEKK